MSSELAITPRNLGSICLCGYCPACLYRLLKMKFHPPFNHFGAAIFGDMQDIQESIIGYFLEKDGCLPKEFAPFCDCSARAEFPRHWSKFKYTHKSGVVLYGAPDEIFTRADGTLCVIDLKTAHAKGDDDPFHGQYEVQVVGYGNIAEGLGLGEVTQGGLLYWDIQHHDVEANPSAYYVRGKLAAPFLPKPLEIEIDYKILDPLLDELKDVWNATSLPEGRPGCKDCLKHDLLIAIHEDLKIQDRIELRGCEDSSPRRKELVNRDFNYKNHLRSVLDEFSRIGGLMFEPDGMIANWEFLEESAN